MVTIIRRHMAGKYNLQVPFKLLDTASTIRLGISSIISLFLCILIPLIIVLIAFELDSENLGVVQWLLYTIALCIFLSGLFGLMVKQFADALSIGLSLHEEKTQKIKKTHSKLNYYDSLRVGFQNLGVIFSVVFMSSSLLLLGGFLGDIVPETYECSSGKTIPISNLEDGFEDCWVDLFDKNGNLVGSYAEDEQSGIYVDNATPNPIYGILENLFRLLSGIIFIGGIIGLTGKFFVDSISVGLTLHGKSAMTSQQSRNYESE